MADGQVTIAQAQLEALHTRLDEFSKRMEQLEQQAAIFRHLGWLKLALSAFTAGMIGFWGPILIVAAAVPGETIPWIAWLGAIGAGCIGVSKDMRAMLELPPVATNGSIPLPKPLKGGTT